VPFVVVIVLWQGLRQSFPAFQGADEVIHFSIVRTVAAQWPRPLLRGYGAWSGPLVYWAFATLARPFGTSLQAARLVDAAFSWGACALAYVIFRDRLGARPRDALALALLLSVSPFFLGQSFHVLTDNPTWFFVVLGLERSLAYVRRPGLGKVVAFALCLAAATTMRQIAAWMVLPALVAFFSVPMNRGRRVAVLAIVAAGLVPVAALLVYWGGPLPPPSTSVPGSVETSLALGYRLRNLLLALAVAGMYVLFLLPSAEVRDWWDHAQSDRRWAATLAVSGIAALALVVAGSLGTITSFLTLVSRIPFPAVAGASLLFWVLVPIGAAAVAGLVTTRLGEVTSRVFVAALAGVLLSAAVNPRWFERYVDFAVLLVFAGLALTAQVAPSRGDRERWLLAGVIAIASFFLLL
jgi:hypothetical protein